MKTFIVELINQISKPMNFLGGGGDGSSSINNNNNKNFWLLLVSCANFSFLLPYPPAIHPSRCWGKKAVKKL